MIRGYLPKQPEEPQLGAPFQWSAALGAGFVAGMVLLILPRGSPWATLTFFSRAIMGRTVLPGLPLVVLWAIHLGVAIFYGLIISAVVFRLPVRLAVLAGGLCGFGLYWANFAVVSACWPQLRGDEGAVAFSHIVFGLLAGGLYRGFLRRRSVAISDARVTSDQRRA